MPRDAPAVRCFDLKDELRATADRRKQLGSSKNDAQQYQGIRGEGIAQIATRLSVMFPALPEDTVQAILSGLFRANSNCSREELADQAVCALVEMSVESGEPHTVTSFEPRCSHQDVLDDGQCEDDGVDALMPGECEPSAAQALHMLEGETGDEFREHTDPLARSGLSTFDDMLDSRLADLLALPDAELLPCVRTLTSIISRIASEPDNEKVRSLRFANQRFSEQVGRHECAINILRLAGFEDATVDGDKSLNFFDDPTRSTAFTQVGDMLKGILEDISPQVSAPTATSSASMPNTCRRENAAARRNRIAELTEQRLADPRGFRERSKARGSANVGVGGNRPRVQTTSSPLQPQRRSQHFTLADIERMRVSDEIANVPSYADEYRRSRQSEAVRDYSTLVARSYDPELVARQALDGTNRYRATKGLAPCRWHDGIARIAAEHAASMASGAAPFNHDGFEARAAAFPVAHRGAAENLALNSGVANVADCAVDGWIKSPGHERNLRGAFNLCGIGVARAANGTFYLTQLFALAL